MAKHIWYNFLCLLFWGNLLNVVIAPKMKSHFCATIQETLVIIIFTTSARYHDNASELSHKSLATSMAPINPSFCRWLPVTMTTPQGYHINHWQQTWCWLNPSCCRWLYPLPWQHSELSHKSQHIIKQNQSRWTVIISSGHL